MMKDAACAAVLAASNWERLRVANECYGEAYAEHEECPSSATARQLAVAEGVLLATNNRSVMDILQSCMERAVVQ